MNRVLRSGWWLAAALVAAPMTGAVDGGPSKNSLVWPVDSVKLVGGHVPIVFGAPVAAVAGRGLRFDGNGDALILPVDPIAGLKQFTIEVLFEPEEGGPTAQRFLHIEDESGSRTLMEIRMGPDGRWCLDTFLLCRGTRITLIDRTRLHPAGREYWVALRCDGRRMDHFVNGIREGEGDVLFTPFGRGRMSLGARLNRISWFKGVIREVRIHPTALSAENLQRLP
jgi:Concanavalin A-like lectin/glucanases superfamily